MSLSQGLTIEEFSSANRRRCEEAFHPIEEWSLTDWACAAAGELGEACNLIKKRRRGGKWEGKVMPGEIAKELADAVTYIDLMFSRLGLSMSDFLVLKFNEVSERVESSVRLP